MNNLSKANGSAHDVDVFRGLSPDGLRASDRTGVEQLECPLAAPFALDFEIIYNPTSTAKPEGIFLELFQFWWQNWQDTLNELNVGPLFSDPFLRQDFHVVLRFEEHIIGSVSFRFLIPSALPCWIRDSALSAWPKEVLVQFQSMRVLLASWLIVHPDFREKRIGDEKLSEALLKVMPEMMNKMGADICLGTPRADRKMHEKMKRFGAVDFGSSHMFGVPVQLMGFLAEHAEEKMLWNMKLRKEN